MGIASPESDILEVEEHGHGRVGIVGVHMFH
jgi:hypothetical protein